MVAYMDTRTLVRIGYIQFLVHQLMIYGIFLPFGQVNNVAVKSYVLVFALVQRREANAVFTARSSRMGLLKSP